MKQFIFLGRQPILGKAELIAQLDTPSIQSISDDVLTTDQKFDPKRFGGITQSGIEIGRINGCDWQAVVRMAEQHLLSHPTDAKVTIGISAGNLSVGAIPQQQSLLALKKRLKQAGHSLRIVMPKNGQLNAAQIRSNGLLSSPNLALVPIAHKSETIIVQLTWAQDINDYAARDYDRPFRDGFVGMLPPKLAQIMLNLAVRQPLNQGQPRILDPFCGTGVVLQEALLHGFAAYGTDLSEKMVDYSQKNIDWLRESRPELLASTIEAGDARTHKWHRPIDAVVGETYLGEPQTTLPSHQKLRQLQHDSGQLLSSFLKNLAPQLNPETPLCLALPAWRQKNGSWADSPVIDEINRLGYTHVSFPGVKTDDLLYYRSDQYVARRLLVLKRKR
jgi:tRNA G10  N-methylase Trm11